MRVLVADQNAVLLAAISGTFGRHCDLVTATRRDMCLEHAERQKFDVVVAGDKLADYTGLELLSEVAGLYPDTLLIFAASPARLKRLGGRLELFGLLETISYPLTPRKLLEALKLARRVLRPRTARKVRHVVLESEWDTGERLGLIERELEDETAGSNRHEGWHTQDATDEATAHAAPADTSYEAGDTARAAARGTQPQSAALDYSGAAADDAEDDFVFAAPPPATVSADSSKALIELPPSAVPVVCAVSAHVSRAVVVSNDPVFDEPSVPEKPPIEASVPAEPQWAEDGAANDTTFEAKLPRSGASAPQARTHSWAAISHETASSRADSAVSSRADAPGSRGDDAGSRTAGATPRTGERRPKVRAPAKPTAAQIAAFERAVARRNAERGAAHLGEPNRAAAASRGRGGRKKTSDAHSLSARASSFASDVSSMFTGSRGGARVGAAPRAVPAELRGMTATGTGPSKSLSELARMAANKRPLVDPKLNRGAPAQKRTVFVVGSGLAAVLLLGVLTFELLRTPETAERLPRAHSVSAPFAAQGSMAASDGGMPAQVFSPPTIQPATASTATAANLPQAQNFDAEAAPPDPPPPPALEHPGPMEPPSMSIERGPPMGMVPPGFEPQPEEQ